MESVLVKCIERSLHEMMLRNAIFLCERLCAEFPSEVNLQLLARCYLNNNQPYCAYNILKGMEMPESRYLFAMACFRMDLLREAEAALLHNREPGAVVPNGAAGHYLLGLVYRYTDRTENSVEHLRMALVIDPLCWAAYEELCALGAAEEASTVFSEAAVGRTQEYHLSDGSSCMQTVREDQSSGCAGGGPSNSSLFRTPSPMPTQLSDIALLPIRRNVEFNSSSLEGKSSLRTTNRAPRRKLPFEGKSRKFCERLLSDSGPRRSPRLAAMRMNPNTSQVEEHGTSNLHSNCLAGHSSSSTPNSTLLTSSEVSNNESLDEGNRAKTFGSIFSQKTSTSSSASSLETGIFPERETSSQKLSDYTKNTAAVISGISDILGLLRILGEGYRLLCMYKCQDALDTYRKLSLKHYNTGWVLSQVGKAYFELVDYLNADFSFSLARRVTPYILEGMDVYSTVLYHLQEEMKLSHLAQELISIDRLAPQSWCAIGNCYSLQKDHETAVKSFSRAVQLNSRFAYAYTLLGHEYAELEEYGDGLKCYQSALRVDSRHYNAWYGLGMIYLRQEKYEFSEHHFRMAFHINPCSSAILCYIGTALHELKRNEEALELLETVILSYKKNPFPLYLKAKVLVSLQKFKQALEVLEELKEYAPFESSVYALMGKAYMHCKMYDMAVLHFQSALDLKPSAPDTHAIKASIEKLLVDGGLLEDLNI